MHNLRTFYILSLTQLFSLIGSRMTGIAVGLWLFDQTGNTAPLLTAAFFAEIPGMVSGSITGMIADRWDRRYVMILGDAGQAVATLFLMLSFLTDQFQLWHLYVVMLMQGIFAMIQSPASEATVAMLIPDDFRDRANGIRQTGFPLAGVFAPVFAGLIYTQIGVEGVMAFDLLTFGIAVLVVFASHIPRPPVSAEGQEHQGSLWREMSGGWRYLARRRALLGMVCYLSFIFFLINGPLGLAIPYLKTVTGSEATTGILLGVMNFGAFCGAAYIAMKGSVRQRLPVIMAGYFLLGIMLVLHGIARDPILLGMTLFLVMFPLPLNGALFASILQLKTPPDMQGRVFAISEQLFMIATPFSFLMTGEFVDKVLEPAVGKASWDRFVPLVGDQPGAGMGLLLLAVGVVIMITTVAVYAIPAIRHLEQDLPNYRADESAPEIVLEEAIPASPPSPGK